MGGVCCSCGNNNKQANTIVLQKIKASTGISTTCSADCTAIKDLIEYYKISKPSCLSSEQLEKQRDKVYAHYVEVHATMDDRSNNLCSDTQCQYESQHTGSLPKHARIHAYFYHHTTYLKLRTSRSLHYNDAPSLYYTITPAPSLYNLVQPAISKTPSNTRTVTDCDFLLVGLTPNTSKTNLKLSKTVSFLPLSPGMAGNDNFSLSDEAESCPDSTGCDKLKALLEFSKNVDPENTDNEYDEKHMEEMQSYWDHYCEAHMKFLDTDKTYNCVHIHEEGDGELCYFVQNVQSLRDGRLQLLLHRHFYHENIMREETKRIEFMSKTMRGQKLIDKFKPAMDAILQAQNIETGQVLEFGYEFTCDKQGAKFKNPKEEILKNDYFALEKQFWNDLFAQCTATDGYVKTFRTRKLKLKLKEVIVLKLYTDFDDLQKAYRKCFRQRDEKERAKIQSQFYHWNKLLKCAVGKSQDIITETVFHGISVDLNMSTFAGKYYGPVSTTKCFVIAQGFAGDNGKILELYPSYGRRGLEVSWLSNFPDEQEVLYFDASFNIKNIFTKSNDDNIEEMHVKTGSLLSARTIRNLKSNTKFIEKAIVKALQTVNIGSTVLSFNEIDAKDDDGLTRNSKKGLFSDEDVNSEGITAPLPEEKEEKYENDDNMTSSDDDGDDEKTDSHIGPIGYTDSTIETFDALHTKELVAILYLLYLQYKPTEWEKMVKSDNDVYTQMALAKYRDQFAYLTQKVTSIRLEKASELIKYFFSTNMESDENNIIDAIPSINDIDNDDTNAKLTDIITHSGEFVHMKYNINFATFVKLFPLCKEILIDGDNFDWTLRDFIDFLKLYNLNYSGICLQDIVIRFRPDYLAINADDIAKQRLEKSRKQLAELAKLGWRFASTSHIHRFGFEPEPEKPFLIVFMTEGRVFHRSYSKQILNTPKLDMTQVSHIKLFKSPSSSQANEAIEGDHAVIDYNPKHLFLSQQMINKCHYKDDLIALLENRKRGFEQLAPKAVDSHSLIDEALFHKICEKVETLILHPMHTDLMHIFYETCPPKKPILSLQTIQAMFPNVSDIYLRDIAFNPRMCNILVEFISSNKREANKRSNIKIKRIFYSVRKRCATRDIAKVKLRLNVCGWDFSIIEQVVFKTSRNNF